MDIKNLELLKELESPFFGIRRYDSYDIITWRIIDAIAKLSTKDSNLEELKQNVCCKMLIDRLEKMDSTRKSHSQYGRGGIIDKLKDFKLNSMTKGQKYAMALMIKFLAEKKDMDVFPKYIEKILKWDEVKEKGELKKSVIETLKKRLGYEKTEETKKEKAIKSMDMKQKKCPSEGLQETISDTKDRLIESKKGIKSIENTLKELQS